MSHPFSPSDPSETVEFGSHSNGGGTVRVRRSGRRRALLVGGVSLAVVGTATVGGLAAARLMGGGAQPEDVLPASTVALVKVDLDPAAGQKVNVLRLLDRFPDLDVDEDDLKSGMIRDLFDGNDLGLSYAEDLEPWIGDRMAVAAVAAPDTAYGVEPMVVAEFTDEDAMRSAMKRIETAVEEEADGLDFAYAVRDDYVLMGLDQAQVDDAAGATKVLSEDETFAADVDAIDGEGKVALMWGDVGAAYGAVSDEHKGELEEILGDAAPQGRFSLAVSVGSDHVEVAGRSADVAMKGVNQVPGATPAGTEAVRGFPADTEIALSATALGAHLSEMWSVVTETEDELLGSLAQEAAGIGITLPDDLESVFGSELALGAHVSSSLSGGGEEMPDLYVDARTDDAQGATDVLTSLLGNTMIGDLDVSIETTDDGYVAATSEEKADEVMERKGGLGDSDVFTDVVPDAEDASALLFVDVAAVFDGAKDLAAGEGETLPEETKYLEPLRAIGMTTSNDDTSAAFRIRATFR